MSGFEMTPARARQRIEHRIGAAKWDLQRAASRLQKGDATAREEVDRCKEQVKTLQARLEEM